MASLDRALALEHMDDVSVSIGEDLKLDVPRLLDQPFYVECAVAKRGKRLTSRLRDRLDEIAIAPRSLHPNSAATF